MQLRTWGAFVGLALSAVAALPALANVEIQDRFVGDCAIGRPASALIYPLVDSRPGKGTLISVTNVNCSRTFCGTGDFRFGDVCLALTFFGRDPGDFSDPNNFCFEFDVQECLTPGDTITFIADQLVPTMEVGWLWVEARDPETQEAIDFDYLIGSAIVVDMGLDFLARYVPYGFRALPNRTWGWPSTPNDDRCGRAFTDEFGNGDGFADFDGVEYDFWPAILLLDNFFEEGGHAPSFTSTIALASCDVDPHDENPTTVTVFTWNNNEQRFSRNFHFECFFLGSLVDISPVFGGLHGDPNELVTDSGKPLQTGWAEFIGSDALLGVIIERVTNSGFGGGDTLEMVGQFGGINDPANNDGSSDNDHDPCRLARF